MQVKMPEAEILIVVGEHFNVSITENRKHRVLEISILAKDAQYIEGMPLTRQLELEQDKHFQTLRVRALGQDQTVRKFIDKRKVKVDKDGETPLSDKLAEISIERE